MSSSVRKDLRNIGIIAHVDHGKTTLVDFMLKQSGTFGDHEVVAERVMDSNDLEREKGITILAKNTAINIKGTKVNIVDTPGHADFGGEVERIMGMVDGAILLVDAAEGPLPQTRFVLKKALSKGHKVILCINKVDRPEVRGEDFQRIDKVIDETFDLFVELGASEEQCDFPILYACGRQGWAIHDRNKIESILDGGEKANLSDLFQTILDFIPAPTVEEETDFKFQLSNLGWSDYVGRLSIGRAINGTVKKNQTLYRIGFNDKDEVITKSFTAAKLFTYEGLKQVEVDTLRAGEIGIIAGCEDISIGETIASSPKVTPFPQIKVEIPTLKMLFSVNTSPFSGKDGEAIQSRKLQERLLRECRANVALQFETSDIPDQFFLKGRGELQFAILIETMRREGLEFMVGRPLVMTKKDEQGQELEPFERAVLDFPEASSGDVTEMFQQRKGIMTSYEAQGEGRVRLIFDIPSRGLLGMRSRYLTATRGEGLISSEFKGFELSKGEMLARKNGTLIADRTGKSTDYALSSLEDRGILFIDSGTEVYEGMIIGECNKENDMNVNPTKEKKLTNVRSVTSDGLTILAGRKKMSLEEYIEWIDDDEWIECTPEHIRIRKKVLAANGRSVIRGKSK